MVVPEARVKAIRDFRKPITKRDMRSFLGTVGYYWKFIPNFAKLAWSLNGVMKKSAPQRVEWSNSLCRYVLLCVMLV